jgi:hypothetical protein
VRQSATADFDHEILHLPMSGSALIYAGSNREKGCPMRVSGSCHCGNIAFEAEGDFAEAMECNCSFCRRQGALLAFVPRAGMELKTPRDNLKTYFFNKKVIAHHFCPQCGMAPFGEASMPDGTEMTAINLRCVPEIDLEGLKITRYDGAAI